MLVVESGAISADTGEEQYCNAAGVSKGIHPQGEGLPAEPKGKRCSGDAEGLPPS